MFTHRNSTSLAATRRLAAIIGIVALGHLAAPSSAPAQALGNLWFKVAVKAQGMTIDGAGMAAPASFNTTAYMYLNWNGDYDDYDFFIFTETVPGTWSNTHSDAFETMGAHEDLFVDVLMKFYSGGVGVEGYQTSHIVIKRDSFGALKKATIETLGAEATRGSLNGKQFRGGYKMKATTIDADKVPFIVF